MTATIGDDAAGDHGGRETADAIVAKYCGGQSGGIVDQRHADAIDRCAGNGIENSPQRINQRIAGDIVGRVERILIAQADAGVRGNGDLAVVRSYWEYGTGAGNHRGENTTVGTGLPHQDGFGIAGNGSADNGDVEGFPHQRVEIAIGIGQGDVDRFVDMKYVRSTDFDWPGSKVDASAAAGGRLVENYLGGCRRCNAVDGSRVGSKCRKA